MAFADQKTNWLKGLAGALGAAAISFSLSFCHARSMTGEQIRRELEQQPSTRETAQALERYYPSDFRRIADQLAAIANSSTVEAARTQGFVLTQQFMMSKMAALSNAPAADLAELADVTAGLVEEMKRHNTALCAQFVMDGLRPGTQLPPELMTRVSNANAIQLRAAYLGEQPGRVPRGEVDSAGAQLWYGRLRGLVPALAPRVADGTIERATETERCEAGVAVYRSIADMPDELSANLFATILRENAASGVGRPSPGRAATP